MRAIITLVLSLFLINQSLPLYGQSKAPAPARKTPEINQETKSKARPLPFRGTVKAVDLVASTFTIGKRTFQVSKQTKILSEGRQVELKENLVSQWITGSYRTTPEGKIEANTVYVGGKAAAEPKAKKKS